MRQCIEFTVLAKVFPQEGIKGLTSSQLKVLRGSESRIFPKQRYWLLLVYRDPYDLILNISYLNKMLHTLKKEINFLYTIDYVTGRNNQLVKNLVSRSYTFLFGNSVSRQSSHSLAHGITKNQGFSTSVPTNNCDSPA